MSKKKNKQQKATKSFWCKIGLHELSAVKQYKKKSSTCSCGKRKVSDMGID